MVALAHRGRVPPRLEPRPEAEVSALALAIALVMAALVSEARWRDGLTAAGRVLLPLCLGTAAWLCWLLLGSILGLPR